MAEVRDPVHQFIELSDLELAMIDTPAFQRLRSIHQLSLGFLVWPGANHTRFEHALGTMELAGRALDTAFRNSDQTLLEKLGWGTEGQRETAKQYARLGALLHDVGHSPFSHGPEELFPDGIKHEHMSVRVITESEIGEKLGGNPYSLFSSETVADIAVGPEFREIKDEATLLLAELVTGSVGVDRWDYLLRDSLFTGVRYGIFDIERLLQSLRVAEYEGSPVWALEPGGQYAAEQMLLARWFMFLNVYCHKTRRILDRHLTDFLVSWLPSSRFPDGLDDYLTLTDAAILGAIRNDEDFRKLLLLRGHYRQVREFDAGDFDRPDDFSDFARDLDRLGIPFKQDRMFIEASPPRQEDFYVLNADGTPASLVGALDVVQLLRPRWVARIYGQAEDRVRLDQAVTRLMEKRSAA